MSELQEPQLEAWRALVGAHAAVTAATERALAEAGLPPLSWFEVLWALYRAPERSLRMSELAEQLTLSRGGATKLVDRIEAAGLMTRRSCPADRRGQHAILLRAGVTMLRRMRPVFQREWERHFASAISDDEAAVIRDALLRARESACSERPPEEAEAA